MSRPRLQVTEEMREAFRIGYERGVHDAGIYDRDEDGEFEDGAFVVDSDYHVDRAIRGES